MDTSPALRRLLATTVILVCLSVQTAAVVGGVERLGWPFVSYPMYSWTHRWGETVERYAIFGITPDGAEIPVPADDLNMNFWEYLWGPVEAIRKNKIGQVQHYLKLDRRLNSRKIVGVRLESRPILFTRHGAEPLAPKTVNIIRMEDSNPVAK